MFSLQNDAPDGMIHITLHRPEVYSAYERKIAELEKQLEANRYEIFQMSLYAEQYLRALDELKLCERLLKRHGEDTSFILSTRRKK